MKASKTSRPIIWLMLFITINFMAISRVQAQGDPKQKEFAEKFKAMTPQQRADFQTNTMLDKLKLGNQQLAKVKEVNLKYALKFQPILMSDKSRFSKFRAFKSLQEEKDVELKDIFTTSQFKQYKDYEDEMRKMMKAEMKDK